MGLRTKQVHFRIHNINLTHDINLRWYADQSTVLDQKFTYEGKPIECEPSYVWSMQCRFSKKGQHFYLHLSPLFADLCAEEDYPDVAAVGAEPGN